MKINNRLAKILSLGKILTAGLLGGVQHKAMAEPFGNVHTYPADDWNKSTGNSVVWHPRRDNALTISLFGQESQDYLAIYRVVHIDTSEIIVPFTPLLQGTFPENGHFSTTIENLDFSPYVNHKIQFFMVYNRKQQDYHDEDNFFNFIQMSEIDNICISDIYIECTGS